MGYTIKKGDLTEVTILKRFIELGYQISIPWSVDCRYDFIIDKDNKLSKIQVKSCHRRNNSLVMSTSSVTRSNAQISYVGQIDYFATVHDNKVYLIPISVVGNSKSVNFQLRKEMIRNYSKIKVLDDYLI